MCYVPEQEGVFVVITAYDLEGKPPDGWDAARLQKVLTHYTRQSDEEAVHEDKSGVEPSETLMNVPYDLVPEIRELIAKHTRITQRSR